MRFSLSLAALFISGLAFANSPPAYVSNDPPAYVCDCSAGGPCVCATCDCAAPAVGGDVSYTPAYVGQQFQQVCVNGVCSLVPVSRPPASMLVMAEGDKPVTTTTTATASVTTTTGRARIFQRRLFGRLGGLRIRGGKGCCGG